jgi:hypothetical protein
MSCEFKDVYRREGFIGLILLTTIIFLFVMSLLVVKCRRTVLPCCFKSSEKYETLYSAPDFESEDTIQIIKATPQEHKEAAISGEFKAGPEAV